MHLQEKVLSQFQAGDESSIILLKIPVNFGSFSMAIIFPYPSPSLIREKIT